MIDPLNAPTRLEYVNELVSPTERAVQQFEQFVREWTAPALFGTLFENAVVAIPRAIRSIAPVSDAREVVGHAVFRLELDERYDLAHVCVTPVFRNLVQVQNSLAAFQARKEGNFVVCEVRQSHIHEKRIDISMQ